jgi:hypothetical protein
VLVSRRSTRGPGTIVQAGVAPPMVIPGGKVNPGAGGEVCPGGVVPGVLVPGVIIPGGEGAPPPPGPAGVDCPGVPGREISSPVQATKAKQRAKLMRGTIRSCIRSSWLPEHVTTVSRPR